jgi:hypothetical protein
MTSFTCPDCGRTSHNPQDMAEGYCGHCHWWTLPVSEGAMERAGAQLGDTPCRVEE